MPGSEDVKSSAFAAIILAGGLSSRMGSFKPLMMIDDETHGRLDDKSVRKIVAAQKKQSKSH